MVDALYPFVRFLARSAALLGGIALIALVVMTVVSIIGRNFTAFGPVPGDFELVEAGVAFAIFAFMPWCQLNRGHAAVEILASRFGVLFNNLIDLISDVLLLGLWIFLGYRHFLGMLDKKGYSETTFILQYPIWWAYAAALAGIVVIVIVSIFCVLRSIRNLTSRRLPEPSGAIH